MLHYNPEDRVQKLLEGQLLSLPQTPPPLPAKALLFLRERAFLGQRQPYQQRTNSGRLTAEQIAALKGIGINCFPKGHYHRGIVNAATRNGKPLDLRALHNYICARLTLIRAHPHNQLSVDSQALLRGLELCVKAQIALLSQRNGLSEVLQREQQLQLAQLGTLLLPTTLISTLREPVHFVDTTATAIGRLAEVVLRQGESQCQPSHKTNSSTCEARNSVTLRATLSQIPTSTLE